MHDTRRVAILGGGLVAAYVWYACREHHIVPDVYTKDVPLEPPPGALWLYRVPDKLSSEVRKQKIDILSVGDAVGYSMAIWGEEYPCSFPEESTVEYGYDPRQVLPLLRGLDSHQNAEFKTDEEVIKLAKRYDLVLQTFPTQRDIANQPGVAVISGCARKLSQRSLNWVMYNGCGTDFVRCSTLFGYQSYECPACSSQCTMRKLGATVSTLRKIHPTSIPVEIGIVSNVFLVGRYAQWKRKMMVHEAYDRVCSILSGNNS